MPPPPPPPPQQQLQPSAASETTGLPPDGNGRLASPPPQQRLDHNGSDAETLEAMENAMNSLPQAPGGIYAPLLRMRQKREMTSATIVPLPPKVIGGLRDQSDKIKQCNCRRSNCLKLYCDCFSGGIHCNAYCTCNSCYNDGALQHQLYRNKAILHTLEKNQHSFRPRVSHQESGQAGQPAGNFSGPTKATICFCKRSRCLKKYCECFQAGGFCSAICRCALCANQLGNRERDAIVANKIKSGTWNVLPDNAGPVSPPTTTQLSTEGNLGGGDANNNDNHNNSNAAANVDQHLPPSFYTTQMTLSNGLPVYSLAFGRGSAAAARASNIDHDDDEDGEDASAVSDGEIPAQTTQQAALPATVNPTEHDNRKPKRTLVEKRKEMERKWELETVDVMRIFDAMKKELVIRSKENRSIEDAQLMRVEAPQFQNGHGINGQDYYSLRAMGLLASLELDVNDVIVSMQDAERETRKRLKKEVVKSPTSGPSNHMDVERNDNESPSFQQQARVSDNKDASSAMPHEAARSETTATAIVKASQDAALLRELARIIQRRAVEMAEIRASNML